MAISIQRMEQHNSQLNFDSHAASLAITPQVGAGSVTAKVCITAESRPYQLLCDVPSKSRIGLIVLDSTYQPGERAEQHC